MSKMERRTKCKQHLLSASPPSGWLLSIKAVLHVMDKLVGIVIVVTVLAVWLAVWLLPVYFLILASVLVNPQDWREVNGRSGSPHSPRAPSGWPLGTLTARSSANLQYPILARLRAPLRGLGPEALVAPSLR